jgi:DNA-binding NtrC family response regulator
MLRFDRYLVSHDGARDLATGARVEFERVTGRRDRIPTLFQTCGPLTLIDVEQLPRARIEVWEPWVAGPVPKLASTIALDFTEVLECARLGAPRAFDLPALDGQQDAYLRRSLAREARLRGWVPIALEELASAFETTARRPAWLRDRSLVIFVDVPTMSKAATCALFEISRADVRPHVLVRTLHRTSIASRPAGGGAPFMVHEPAEPFADEVGAQPADARSEASARWEWLRDGVRHGKPSAAHSLQLARVLLAREQPFEARALAEPVAKTDSSWAAEARSLITDINQRAAARAARGWEMVDDFVDVLQLCQDTEDEQLALARVGAFVRDRLQASSVAFVVREGPTARILSRVGSTAAAVDLAVRTLESGVAATPARCDGPVESACPVRHASEVIGALWCRWSAGMSIAPQQASTLLGIAAAAAAPSVRVALARATPLAGVNPVPELVGESGAMAGVREAIMRAAASPFPVVIEGESGSGKELAARAIHARSARRARRFCAINCAALVDDLVEAELFGHARGAYTGATSDRPGLFEDASGGTLFMDEIAELGPRVQAKLLRVLQEGEVRRVGETNTRKTDVRIVAATNRPLAAEVATGAFRADLWYRLDVLRITLPPLRERIEDVPLLANHLWRTLAARTGSRAALAPSTIAALSAYNWPGNIRELQNVLASLLVAAPRAGLIGPSHLPTHIARVAALDRAATLADARRQFEERYVRAALARAGGRTALAAQHLGLSRQGLTKLMGRLGIASVPASPN